MKRRVRKERRREEKRREKRESCGVSLVVEYGVEAETVRNKRKARPFAAKVTKPAVAPPPRKNTQNVGE